MIDIANIVARLDASGPVRWLLAMLPAPLRRYVERHLSLIYALLLHAFILGVFVVGIDWSTRPTPSQAKPKVNVIAATVIDEAQVQAEIDKLKKAETQRQSQDDARQRQLKKDEGRLAELKKKKALEERRLQEQKKKRQTEEKKTKALAVKKKVEQEKLNKLKKQQAAIKKEQQALEKKRKAEQKRLAELEKKRKAEAERQEKLEQQKKKLEQQKKKEEQQRREAEQALQQQLEAEQAAESQREMNREIDRHKTIIQQKVTRNWLRPPSTKQGLSCTVAVRLIPGGEVLTAQVVKSSGDVVFDRSVESAVLKASPLPLPSDGALFERFRELEFVFSPES